MQALAQNAAIGASVLFLVAVFLRQIPGLGLVARLATRMVLSVSPIMLVVLGLLAALAYALDFVAAAFGARKYGSSAGAAIGALIGAVVGIFFGLPGLILGPFIGAVLGQLSAAPELRQAVRAGWGAWIGLVIGIAVKSALAVMMIGLFAVARFV